MDAPTIVETLKARLGLKRHPTCGFVAETFRDERQIPQSALPDLYDGPRPYSTALYFLVTPGAHIRLHRIRAHQLYHHYAGDPLDVLLLSPDGRGEVAVCGADVAHGMRPQLLVPGGTFHMSRLHAGGEGWALLGSTEWPGVEPADVERGDVEALVRAYPQLEREIRAFVAAQQAPAEPPPVLRAEPVLQ